MLGFRIQKTILAGRQHDAIATGAGSARPNMQPY
jgi:hypothetical protein